MKMSKKVFLGFMCLLFVTLSGYAGGSKENTAGTDPGKFPRKEITLICPWAPGAGADAVCRMFEKLGPKYFGRPIVVVNKAGAGGQLATVEYKVEKPDGYTILFSSSGLFTTQPLMGEVDYKIDDFVILTGITSDYNVLVCNSSLGVKNLKEFIDYYKKAGTTLRYGHSGTGTIPHLVQAMFYNMAGIKAEQIPFNSSAEAVPALLGGHVMAIAQGTSEMAKLIGNKNAVVLSVFGDNRSTNENLKNIPTAKEEGYDISLCVWRLMLAHKGTPPEVVQTLRTGLLGIINDPEFRKFADEQGIIVDPKDEKTALDTIATETKLAEGIFKDLKMGIFSN